MLRVNDSAWMICKHGNSEHSCFPFDNLLITSKLRDISSDTATQKWIWDVWWQFFCLGLPTLSFCIKIKPAPGRMDLILCSNYSNFTFTCLHSVLFLFHFFFKVPIKEFFSSYTLPGCHTNVTMNTDSRFPRPTATLDLTLDNLKEAR